jgi:hypothetical protein
VNPLYTINFRREAYVREVAKTRRRALSLGLWVLYFGALGIVLGLSALHAVTLSQRVGYVERQVERMRHRPASDADWRPGTAEAENVTRHLASPRVWRTRLSRLPQIMPDGARLRSLAYNPDNVSGAGDVKLVLTGEMHGAAGSGRLQEVMGFVNALSRDSVFAAGFRNVRLVTTRALASGDGTEFVVECR